MLQPLKLQAMNDVIQHFCSMLNGDVRKLDQEIQDDLQSSYIKSKASGAYSNNEDDDDIGDSVAPSRSDR